MQFKQKKLLLYYQPTPTILHDMGDSTLHTTLTHVVPRGRLKRLEREPSPERGSRIAIALRPRFHKARIIGGTGKHPNTLVIFSSVTPPTSISSMASAREQPGRAVAEATGCRVQRTMETAARWVGLR